MMIRNVILLVVMVVFFAGLFFAREAYSFTGAPENFHGISHKMKKGDSLWKLARKYYGAGRKYTLLKKVNGIKDVRKIHIGKIIYIPQIVKKAALKKLTYPNVVDMIKTVDAQKLDGKKVETEETDVVAGVSSEKVENGREKFEVKELKEAAIPLEVIEESKSVIETSKKAFVNNSSAKSKSVLDMSRESIVQPKLEVKSEKVSLEFGPEDRMFDNDSETKIDHLAHGGVAERFEHEASIDTMYSTNKVETMKSAMVDYMSWFKIPSLDESFRLGAGLTLGIWEEKMQKNRFMGVLPAAQLGFRYNYHTPNHLMRMLTTKLMIGREFQNLRSEKLFTETSQKSDDMIEPANEKIMLDSENQSDQMGGMMAAKAIDSLKLGIMSEYHHELNPKSMLGIMGGGWIFSKANMAMDPTFFANAYHVYRLGDWTWKIGVGSEYENWSDTWRLKIIPAEIGHKDSIHVGIFTDLYPWKKGAMYRDNQDLTTIGVSARFSIGGRNMHKGHEAKN